ncbi:unnamed protein product [Phaeothamnion confervicola]
MKMMKAGLATLFLCAIAVRIDAFVAPRTQVARTCPCRPAARMTELKSTERPELLYEAVETRAVAKEAVTAALEALQAKASGVVTAQDIEGKFELIFQSKLKGGYMPVSEIIGFFPSMKSYTIDTTFGGELALPLGGIRGECAWISERSVLEFRVLKLQFGPISIPKESKPKQYSFFYADDKITAAVSSNGGIALLARQ